MKHEQVLELNAEWQDNEAKIEIPQSEFDKIMNCDCLIINGVKTLVDRKQVEAMLKKFAEEQIEKRQALMIKNIEEELNFLSVPNNYIDKGAVIAYKNSLVIIKRDGGI